MSRNRRSVYCASLLLVACLLVVGCGDDATEPERIDAAGTWTGTTSQGRSFSFVATSTAVTSISMSYQLTGSRCSYTADLTLGGGSGATISNNTFNASFPLGPSLGADFVVTGRFTSSRAANGTISVNDTDCNGTLNATWTASK